MWSPTWDHHRFRVNVSVKYVKEPRFQKHYQEPGGAARVLCQTYTYLLIEIPQSVQLFQQEGNVSLLIQERKLLCGVKSTACLGITLHLLYATKDKEKRLN